MKNGYIYAKSALDKYSSSHTFYAINNEHNNNGLQLVGFIGNPVNEINLLIYTKHIIQHSGLKKV